MSDADNGGGRPAVLTDARAGGAAGGVAPPGDSSSSARAVVGCRHCGLPVPGGFVDPAAEAQFCCAGCRTAFAILNAHGLGQYYDLPIRREVAVRSTGQSYEQFDHAAFRELYVTRGDDGLARVELYLEGVHCASCVWLVERVPLLLPGVTRAELNVRRSLAVLEWDDAVIPLSRIARTLDSLGYAPHPFRGVRREEVRRREDRAALVRIGVAGAIAINVMLPALALYSGSWFGMDPQYQRYFRWISLLLTVPALVWPGRVFFTGALAALRTRTLHMDLPIAVALGAGFLRGALNTVTDHGPIYFDGVTLLVFLLLIGRYVQQRGQRAAADAAELLYSLTPGTVRVVGEDGAVTEAPAEAIVPGQLVEVLPGATIPADGTVEEGTSSINASLLTGESRPVAARTGSPVFAGTLNVSSPVRVRVTEAGESSRLARLLRRIEESARRRAPVVLLADRLAGWFVGIVLGLAALTWLFWIGRDATAAADNAIALLIVTCPCALALATPLAVTAAIGQAARGGIFIKGGAALEQLAHPARLLLDKTGTVTEGRSALVSWEGPDWVRPLILALEQESTHPVADGFRRSWQVTSGALPVVEWSEHVSGGGIRGIVDGREVIVGAPRFVAERVHDAPAALSVPGDAASTPVWIAVDGTLVAWAGFGDPVRPDAASAVERLRARGWRVGLLSGDDAGVVRAVGDELKLPPGDCIAGATPEEKRRIVELERDRGPIVMVGDGVNDAAAIAVASVGIGVHGGAEACLAVADVYLTTPGLSALVRLTDGAARTMRVIRRNFAFSLVYNLAGATLAATGVLDPLIAAVLMPASSLTVVLSSWHSRPFPGAGS